MRISFISYLFVSLLAYANGFAQCPGPGRSPKEAIPVCGNTRYRMDNNATDSCYNGTMVVPCRTNVLNDYFPQWFSFTCYKAGSFGIRINALFNAPVKYILFDITGIKPEEVFDQGERAVKGLNLSTEMGVFGANNNGSNYFVCPNVNIVVPTMSSMPILEAGHKYLLFLGCRVSFNFLITGGTAEINPPPAPHLLKAEAGCNGQKAIIRLNKKFKCSSLSANGSEFSLSPPVANIISASAVSCNYVDETDSVTIKFDQALPFGTYTVSIHVGSDENTLLDGCNQAIPEFETVDFTISGPPLPIKMDSITKPGCKPDELQLVFKRLIDCNSIAANGSDFMITGTAPVNITGASAICDDGLSYKVMVKLSSPIYSKGNFQVRLQKGNDGNTLIDECGKEIIEGDILPFSTKDTVSADFTYNIRFGCKSDTIEYFNTGNFVDTWKWNFDNAGSSTQQNPVRIYRSFGIKKAFLLVSNGVCTDSSSAEINLDNAFKASFEATSIACPGDLVSFNNKSTGNIVAWTWDFGNGLTSDLKTPAPQLFNPADYTFDLPIRLLAQNSHGCFDTAFQLVKIVNNCSILVPNSFTPNGDGLNDYLYPLNAYKAVDLFFRVYDRTGRIVFETTDWTRKWDGRFKGQPADRGTYVWVLKYKDKDSGKTILKKGSTILLH